jgi:hypothetical protein
MRTLETFVETAGVTMPSQEEIERASAQVREELERLGETAQVSDSAKPETKPAREDEEIEKIMADLKKKQETEDKTQKEDKDGNH